MFSSLNDVARHCKGSKHDAGIGSGVALVMYDMRCVPLDDIVACENPDLDQGRSTSRYGIDSNKGSGLGLIDPSDREMVHPLPVEFDHDPFENPKRLIFGHARFNQVLPRSIDCPFS